MKSELATAIGAAIFGVIFAYFICNLFIGGIEPVSFKTVENTVSTDLTDPDPEVFNYEALNPTVEVYVGECTDYRADGQCVDQTSDEGN